MSNIQRHNQLTGLTFRQSQNDLYYQEGYSGNLANWFGNYTALKKRLDFLRSNNYTGIRIHVFATSIPPVVWGTAGQTDAFPKGTDVFVWNAGSNFIPEIQFDDRITGIARIRSVGRLNLESNAANFVLGGDGESIEFDGFVYLSGGNPVLGVGSTQPVIANNAEVFFRGQSGADNGTIVFDNSVLANPTMQVYDNVVINQNAVLSGTGTINKNDYSATVNATQGGTTTVVDNDPDTVQASQTERTWSYFKEGSVNTVIVFETNTQFTANSGHYLGSNENYELYGFRMMATNGTASAQGDFVIRMARRAPNSGTQYVAGSGSTVTNQVMFSAPAGGVASAFDKGSEVILSSPIALPQNNFYFVEVLNVGNWSFDNVHIVPLIRKV